MRTPDKVILGRSIEKLKESRDEMKGILKDIRENADKLSTCKRHLFNGTNAKIGDNLTCSKCGGKMSLTSTIQYVRGYIAAGGDPNSVWTGWDRRYGK